MGDALIQWGFFRRLHDLGITPNPSVELHYSIGKNAEHHRRLPICEQERNHRTENRTDHLLRACGKSPTTFDASSPFRHHEVAVTGVGIVLDRHYWIGEVIVSDCQNCSE